MRWIAWRGHREGRAYSLLDRTATVPPLATKLGTLLAAEKDVVLLDGQSEGTGRAAGNAFGDACVAQKQDLRKRIHYFPNPYSFNQRFEDDRSLLGTLKKWRASLFRAAHIVIVFDGGMGTEAEIDVATEMDCRIVPVPVPGREDGLAHKLLEHSPITKRLGDDYLRLAKSGEVSAKDIVDCVKHILGQ